MADATTIEWMLALARHRGRRAAVWNPIRGCAPASEGCKNCWAAAVANMRQHNPHPAMRARYQGLTRKAADGRAVFNGATRLVDRDIDLPARTRRSTVYFAGSETDFFGEAVEDAWIARVLAMMAACPQHLFICLSKRPQRLHAVMSALPAPLPTPLPNVWLGVSVENGAAAAERLPLLLGTPAALRWISAEPLLEAVDLSPWLAGIGWVVSGGESGSPARPARPEWFRALRDQCAAAGVPFFFKQWGTWAPDAQGALRRMSKKAAGHRLDGAEWLAVPQPAPEPEGAA